MKKTVLTTIGIMCTAILLAGGGQYEKAMGKNIPAMFQAETPESLMSAINQLSRIGDAEKDRWEPYYYAAFGYVRMMEMAKTNDEKDVYLDRALETITKGESIKPNDSELESLRGYVHMMRLVVDPATRGMKYSGLAYASFNKAIKLDPNNGRAHYLLGRMQFGSAQFMGNGDGGACASFATAKSLLESEIKAEGSFAPSWGLNGVKVAMEEMCQG